MRSGAGGCVLGGFLALCAAATFAMNNAIARRGVLSGSVIQAMAISVPFGVPLFLIAAWISGGLDLIPTFSLPALGFMASAGVVHFVGGRYCNYRAVKAIGANLAGPVIEGSTIVALTLAVLLLGEQLTVLKIIGVALILGGPALTVERKPKHRPDLAFTPSYFEGYLYSVFAAFAYGTSPILVSFAISKAGLPASIAAGLISYIAATIAILLVILVFGQVQHVRDMSRETAKWFCWAGFFVGVSQMFRYMALALAPVSVVSPIQRLSLIFRFFIGYIMNRQYEIFSSRILAATIVSLLGAIFLSLSVDAVQDIIPLPPVLEPWLNWKWP